MSSARSLWCGPAHDRNGTDAVFWAAFDNAIAVSNINQNVALPVEKANYVEGLEDEAASLVEDALALFNVADNVDPSDLAARYAGVAGVLCDAQSALDASGLSARDVAGDALDLGVIEAIDPNLVAGP